MPIGPIPANINGAATLPLAIPNDPNLVGRVLYAQAVFFDNGVAKSFSNGLRIRLGDQSLGRNELGHRTARAPPRSQSAVILSPRSLWSLRA